MAIMANPDMVERYREVLVAFGEPHSYVYMAGLLAGMAEQAAEDHHAVCPGHCVTCVFFQQVVALKSAMDLEAGPPPYWD